MWRRYLNPNLDVLHIQACRSTTMELYSDESIEQELKINLFQ